MLAACSTAAHIVPRAVLATATPQPSTGSEREAQYLPLFPLGVVAFPGELVFLHIFEPRYRQLILECAEHGISFGIVTMVSGGASSIGTEMTLERILRTHDSGNMDVATRGMRVFSLQSFEREMEGKLYPGGQVTYTRNDSSFDPELQSALVQLYNRIKYRAGARQAMAAPYPENLSFVIGHDVGLTQSQELQLLTMSVERDRQAYLFQHLVQAQ
jgi:Lon protease-like protein